MLPSATQPAGLRTRTVTSIDGTLHAPEACKGPEELQYYKHQLMTWIQRSLRVSTSEQMVSLQLAFFSRTLSPSKKTSLESEPRWMLEEEERVKAAIGDHEKHPNLQPCSPFLIPKCAGQ